MGCAVRARGRTDGNQAEAVKYMRALGMSVEVASNIGGGFPDLIIGFRGVTCLVELKDGSKVASARVLTKAQEEWHASWAGHRVVCETKEAAAQAVIAHAQAAGVKV